MMPVRKIPGSEMDGGIEVLIAEEVARVFNMSIIYFLHSSKNPDWGHFMNNGTAVGLMGKNKNELG